MSSPVRVIRVKSLGPPEWKPGTILSIVADEVIETLEILNNYRDGSLIKFVDEKSESPILKVRAYPK